MSRARAKRPRAGAPAPLSFKKLRDPAPLYERLAEVILEKVGSGQMAPGERLPRETELAASLGVSRPSVREALKILSALGVLSIRHGAGVYVTAASADDIARRLAPSPALPPDELHHVYEVRRVLESQAAAWAAEMATDEDITALRLVIEETTKLIEEAVATGRGAPPLDRLEQLDTSFHRRVTVASRNAVLIRLTDSMIDLVRESRRFSLSIPGRAIQSVYDHRRVFEAIAARHPVAAARAMHDHLSGVQRDVFRGRAASSGKPAEQRTALVTVNRATRPARARIRTKARADR